MRERKVYEFVDPNGDWNGDILNLIPSQLADIIKLTPSPSVEDGCDTVAWAHSQDGMFSIKSAYNSLLPLLDGGNEALWKKIWKWDGLPKIRTFLWLLSHNRLVTKSLLADRNILHSNLCVFNCGVAETISHCLRDCSLASGIWGMFVNVSLKEDFFAMDSREWVSSNLVKNWGRDDLHTIPWSVVFGVVSWNIWVNRCAVVHGSRSKDLVGIVTRCWADLKEYLGGRRHELTRKEEIMVAWEFPCSGMMKFNTDGSLWSNGNATCGGVLRDDTGRWVYGFARNIGTATINFAELYGIFYALRIARRLQVRYILVESDSIVAIKLINTGAPPEH